MFVKKELKKLCDKIDYKFSAYRDIVYPEYNFPQGFYYPTLKEIRVYNWFIGDQRTYFAGLHEIGHATFSHIYPYNPDIEKRQELEAWEWALENRKIDKLHPNVTNMIVIALRSYGIAHNKILELLVDYG